MRSRAIVFLLLVLAVGALQPEASSAAPGVEAQGGAVPASANRAFLRAAEAGDVDSIMPFLPRKQVLTWTKTIHTRLGSRVEVKRYTREQALGEIATGELQASFAPDVHATVVGSLGAQVMETGDQWVRVNRTRFVPPGSTASSATYVQWRREGSRWVVSSFGDEAYTDIPASSATQVRPRR